MKDFLTFRMTQNQNYQTGQISSLSSVINIWVITKHFLEGQIRLLLESPFRLMKV